MPMLLKMVDPETMKEVAETQAEMHSKMAVSRPFPMCSFTIPAELERVQAFQNIDPTSAMSKFLAPVAQAGDEQPVVPKSGGKKRR